MAQRFQFSARSMLIAFAVLGAIFFLLKWFLVRPVAPALNISGFEWSTIGGREFNWEFQAEISSKLFGNVPVWDRTTQNPPLSASDAMVAASRYIDELVARKQFPAKPRIVRIELVPFNPDKGDWFWKIEFSFQMSGDVPCLDLAVLMDGTVVVPKITERIDLGWPLPNAEKPAKPSGKSDLEIVHEFVAGLNPARLYAGQQVLIAGRLRRVHPNDPGRVIGKTWKLELDDGTSLVFGAPSGWGSKNERDVVVGGTLVGFRQDGDRQESWGGLTLIPGIRCDRIRPLPPAK